ncbi:hypothetical protein UlMin_034708 [Ulmus minor]
MKSSPRRGLLDVFDFNEEEEVSEAVVGKSQNPSLDNHSILKCPYPYPFFECVAQEGSVQTKEVSSLPCVDVDAVDCDLSCGTAKEKSATGTQCSNAVPQSNSPIHEECFELKLDNHETPSFPLVAEKRCSTPEAASPGRSQLNYDPSGSRSSNENEPVDVTSDVEEDMDRSSPSSPVDIAEDSGMVNGYALDRFTGDLEMDGADIHVVLYPDFVMFRDSFSTEAQLTFSDTFIRITGSTASENQGAFDFEWGIDNLINIECQWYQRTETVTIKLRVISRNAFEEDNACGTSGIEELELVVVEPNWPQKQEQIASLNEKYLTIWDIATDTHMVMGTDVDDSPGRGKYFPVFNESFEEVIYPKGDIDAVSISRRDVDLLLPETFINDTIIDFYIKYLQNQIQSEEKDRYHFFNSFFFRKLADLDKDPNSAFDGKAAFQRVRKWTRKVDLFSKDFIFIPINFSLHWSLIVICHPGEVAAFKDEDVHKSLKVPCILHMDSIKGTHSCLKNLLQSYLWEEWKERQKETSEEVSSRFHNMRFVSLELPQQENSFDCGLFLLHYLELFLAEAPPNFNPFKLIKCANFLNGNWFPPSEAYLKRTLIQRLIFKLLESRSREISSAACSDEDQPSQERNENDHGVEFISENLTSSQANRGIEMTLLSASSVRNSQCINSSGLVLRDLLAPGTSAGSVLEQCPSFDQKSYYPLNEPISPMEGDGETGEHFMFFPSGDAGFHQMAAIPQSCEIPYPSRDYGTENYDIGISLQAEHGDNDSSSEPSRCGSVSEHSSPSQKEHNDHDNIVGDNTIVSSNDACMIEDDDVLIPRSIEQQPSKKRCSTPPCESEDAVSQSLANDDCLISDLNERQPAKKLCLNPPSPSHDGLIPKPIEQQPAK